VKITHVHWVAAKNAPLRMGSIVTGEIQVNLIRGGWLTIGLSIAIGVKLTTQGARLNTVS